MVAPQLRAPFDTVAEGASIAGSTGVSGVTATAPIALAAAAIRGARGCQISGNAVTNYLNQTITTSPTAVAQQYFQVSSTQPFGSVLDFMQVRNSTTAVVQARLNTTRTFQFFVSGTAQTLTWGSGYSAAAALPDGWYVVSVAVTHGAGTTDGSVSMWLRRASDDFLVASFTSTTANAGTTDFVQVRHGKTAAGTGTTTYYCDECAAGSGTFGEVDRVPGVTMNAGPDQANIEAGTVVTLDSSGSSGSTGRTWTQTAGQAVTLSSTTATSPTFTAPAMLADGTLTFRVTDNASGVFDDVNIGVLATPLRVKMGGVMVPMIERVVLP